MKILALDPATATGFCWGDTLSGTPKAGMKLLATPPEIRSWGQRRLTRRQDPRPIRLYSFLADLCRDSFQCPDVIVFEDVEFMSYTQQCQLWSSLRAAIWLFSHFHASGCTIDCLNVSSLKKFATGFGGADKALMAQHLYKKHPEYKAQDLDDNGVDAVWLWLWAKQNFARIHGTSRSQA